MKTIVFVSYSIKSELKYVFLFSIKYAIFVFF